MDSIRQQKVARLLQKEIGNLFQKELKHLCQGQMVTVTVVSITPDFSFARVYVSVFPTKEPQQFIEQFNDQIQEIKRILFRRIRNDLRVMPDLMFIHDDSLDHAERIETLLN